MRRGAELVLHGGELVDQLVREISLTVIGGKGEGEDRAKKNIPQKRGF